MKPNGNFTIIPNEFINDSRLDVYEFRILCYLMKLSGCNSSCYPSYETIAREIGMSLSKAKNGIKNLIAHGIITKENREKKSGGTASNLYVVCVKTTDENDEVAENTTDSVPDDSPAGVSEERGKEDYRELSDAVSKIDNEPNQWEYKSYFWNLCAKFMLNIFGDDIMYLKSDIYDLCNVADEYTGKSRLHH